MFGQHMLLLAFQDFFNALDNILLITNVLHYIFSPTLYYPYNLVQLRGLGLTLTLHMSVDRKADLQPFYETILC